LKSDPRVEAVACTSKVTRNALANAFIHQRAKDVLSITQVADSIQIALAQELVREYFSSFFALIRGRETDLTFRGWENELEAIPGVRGEVTCWPRSTGNRQDA
jgi:hypothetical protein